MSKQTRRDVERAARDVVERVRAGDQVAMGIMAEARDRARQGNPRAKQSVRAMQRYLDKNPPVSIGKEGANGSTSPHAALASKALWSNPSPEIIVKALPAMTFWEGVVALVHSPRLDNGRLQQIQATVPESIRADFTGGTLFWQKKSPPVSTGDDRGWLMGRIVGLARCIQRLQLPNVSIATFCPASAWELGE